MCHCSDCQPLGPHDGAKTCITLARDLGGVGKGYAKKVWSEEYVSSLHGTSPDGAEDIFSQTGVIARTKMDKTSTMKSLSTPDGHLKDNNLLLVSQ